MSSFHNNYIQVRNFIQKTPTVYLLVLFGIFVIGLFLLFLPFDSSFAQSSPNPAPDKFWTNAAEYIGGGVANFLLQYIITPFLAFLVFVVGKIVDILAQVLGVLMSYTNLGNISVINDTWKVIRDGINIVFIAALLVAAIFNIIQYEPETYALTEYMPKFVIAVIGVNFSKLMCFFILDFVNVLTASIYHYIGGPGLGTYGENIGVKIKELIQFEELFHSQYYVTQFGTTELANLEEWQIAIMMAIILLMLAFVAHGLAGLIAVFATRLIQLWVLIASSPIFFLGLSSEFISNLSTGWWEDFWKYAALPIKAGAFLAIGIRLADNLTLQLKSSNGSMDLFEIIVVAVCILGTLNAAFDVARDDGAGDKAGDWLKEKIMTPIWQRSLPALGTLGYAGAESLTARGGKAGKFLGGALRLATKPLRVASTVRGLTKAVGEEIERSGNIERLRGARHILDPLANKSIMGFGQFDWAKNATKANYSEQVDSAHKVYQGQTTQELNRSLNKTTDRAELQAIVKELAEGQAVSIRTLFESKDYEKFRNIIGFDYDPSKTEQQNYQKFTELLDQTFPYQFWNTITPAAHKKRQEEIDSADMDTKELEETQMQTPEGIFARARHHAKNGSTYRAAALIARNIQDANLDSSLVNSMLKQLYDEGLIGIDEMNTGGRIGQRDGKKGIAMLRRLTEKQLITAEKMFDIKRNDPESQKKWAEIMQKISNNDFLTTKDGREFNAGSGQRDMFSDNRVLSQAQEDLYNKLGHQDQSRMMESLSNGEAFYSKEGNITEQESNAIKAATESKMRNNGSYDDYDFLKAIHRAPIWFKSNESREDIMQKDLYDWFNEQIEHARGIHASAVQKAYANTTTGGASNAQSMEKMMVAGLTDMLNRLSEVRQGHSKAITGDREELISSLRQQSVEIANRMKLMIEAKTSGNTNFFDNMNKSYENAIPKMKTYFSEVNSKLGLGLDDWDKHMSSVGATNAAQQFFEAYKHIAQKIKDDEDTKGLKDDEKVSKVLLEKLLDPNLDISKIS